MISLVISVTIPNYHSVSDYIPYAVHWIPSDSFIFKFFKLKKKTKQWKQWHTLFLGGSKITANGDCSHEIKRHLQKSYDQPKTAYLKERDYFAI